MYTYLYFIYTFYLHFTVKLIWLGFVLPFICACRLECSVRSSWFIPVTLPPWPALLIVRVSLFTRVFWSSDESDGFDALVRVLGAGVWECLVCWFELRDTLLVMANGVEGDFRPDRRTKTLYSMAVFIIIHCYPNHQCICILLRYLSTLKCSTYLILFIYQLM